jgi:acyl carrier protein
MTREELRSRFEQTVEVPEGSLREDTPLEELEMWDSVAMMTFIALADEATGTKLSARQIRDCKSVEDLLNLTGVTA